MRKLNPWHVLLVLPAVIVMCSPGARTLAGKPGGGPGGPVHYVTPGVGTITEFSGAAGSNDNAYALQQQLDGKWVLGGTAVSGSAYVMGVARYNSDFTPDLGFGNKGTVTLSVKQNATQGIALAIQPDGKIVIAGNAIAAGDIAVARLNPNGSIDTSWDRTGIRTYDLSSGGGDVATAVAIDAQGRIVVGGRATIPGASGSQAFAALRLLPNGSRDSSFNGNGAVVIDISPRTDLREGIDVATSMTIQSDGKIVLAGYCDDVYEGMVRILPNGSLDSTFIGGNGVISPRPGVVTIPLAVVGGPDRALANCVRQDPWGNLVLLGRSVANRYVAHFLRFDSSGALDLSFNAGQGIAEIASDSGFSTLLDSFRLDASGYLVAVGRLYDQFGDSIGLIVHLNPNGTPIGENTVAIPGSVHATEFTDFAFSASGLVLGGTTDAPQLASGRNYVIVKYS